MTEDLLRIGELAARAGVSTRTVDFYTGLGLLTPTRRTGGNFRLYRPGDVQRIAAVRRLEAHGIRLDDIAHVLAGADDEAGEADHAECVERHQGPCPADPVSLSGYLAALDDRVRALQDVAATVDPRTRGALAALAARANALIATALLLGAGVLPGAEALPPF